MYSSAITFPKWKHGTNLSIFFPLPFTVVLSLFASHCYFLPLLFPLLYFPTIPIIFFPSLIICLSPCCVLALFSFSVCMLWSSISTFSFLKCSFLFPNQKEASCPHSSLQCARSEIFSLPILVLEETSQETQGSCSFLCGWKFAHEEYWRTILEYVHNSAHSLHLKLKSISLHSPFMTLLQLRFHIIYNILTFIQTFMFRECPKHWGGIIY